MQDKTWYSVLGLDAEPLFLQDTMLRHCTFPCGHAFSFFLQQYPCRLVENTFFSQIDISHCKCIFSSPAKAAKNGADDSLKKLNIYLTQFHSGFFPFLQQYLNN